MTWSHRSVKGRRGNPGLKGRLLDNSIDAYVLSLETINRLSVKYRVEAFAYLVCNAWELLLKARILDQTRDPKSIYFPRTRRGERPRTLSLRDCLKHVYPSDKEPIRRNVERVADLRDEAVHLVINQIPKDVLALLQACVLNYHKELGRWFDVSLSDIVPVGMMTIVYDLSPDNFDLSMPALRKQMGKDAFLYLSQLQSEILVEREELGNTTEFSVVFDYRLAVTKKPKDADVILTQGEGGVPIGMVHVPRDPARTHPYRQKELVERVNELMKGSRRINAFDVQCISKVHGVPKRAEFYYQSSLRNSPPQYSEEFATWIVEMYWKDQGFFSHARGKVSEWRKGN
jgi:hypothetical protein